MKIITVLGARPQFIKAAVVSRALQEYRPDISEVILHTGQHYDKNMSDIFFEEMKIPKPHYNLAIGGGSHGENTGRMLEQIEKILIKEKPDRVLVYGDTDSTLAGALAAAKMHIPVAHVEAGLRSFNRKMPEELNRILTDQLSDLLFTPSKTGTDNLLNEGISEKNIFQVGDVMHDAILFYQEHAKKPKQLPSSQQEGFVLSTIHRAENTNDISRLTSIISALKKINDSANGVILPLHPRTKKIIHDAKIDTGEITIIDPVGYLEMIWLLQHSSLVVTDSGGLQKEAFFMKKACITTRDETEWTELIALGANVLVGANADDIYTQHTRMLQKNINFKSTPYGSGSTGKQLVTALK